MTHAKVVGVVAALALLVTAFVGVSPAAAFTEFRSEASETTLDGELVEGSTLPATFETDAGTIKCETGSTMGTMTGTSATQLETSLPGSTASGISYGGCKFFGVINVAVNMHNCQYNFHINGEVDITPAGCGPIEFSAAGCTVSVGSQSGLKSVKYEEMTTKGITDVTVNPEISGITYSTSSGCLNGAHTGLTNGKYSGGKFTVRGTHPTGTLVGISLH